MKQQALKLKAFYSNLRIKYKMFVLISIVMLVVSIISLFVTQFAFEVYDKEIYQQSAKSLRLSSSGIENELKKMERLSFRVVTDPEIQGSLISLNRGDASYDRYVTIYNLKEDLRNLGGLDKYILSLQIFDGQGEEYAAGANETRTTNERKQKIKREAAEKSGGISWISPDTDDRALVVGREIRSVSNLDLNHLGTLAIRIDVEKLIVDFARGLDQQDAHFIIFNKDALVYPEELPSVLKELEIDYAGKTGYSISSIGNKRYFITSVPSSYTDWTYMIVIPYDNIFQTINTVKNTMLMIYGLLFVIIVILVLRFARGITTPIESLNMKMKKVQFGNFELENEPDKDFFPMDEAGQMHRNFRIMIQRINDLITDNYKKQLTIKETEFKALQAQINPHFLYNTLESINWMSKMNGQPQVSLMVESLGYLLRNSMNLNEPLIPLKREMEIVNSYITIQKIRFEDRLEFESDIPADVQNTLIPKLSLQPIVENAINYALDQMLGVCKITIRASNTASGLALTVEDNGPGMDRGLLTDLKSGVIQPRGSGIGLRNIDERIKLLFGEAYGIQIESERHVYTRVTLEIPQMLTQERGESHV